MAGETVPQEIWDQATPEQKKALVEAGYKAPAKAPGIGDVVTGMGKDVATDVIKDKVKGTLFTPEAPVTSSTPLMPGGDPGGALMPGGAPPVPGTDVFGLTNGGFAQTGANAAGGAVAAYNMFDAFGNIGSRNGKGTVEGLGTTAGTIGGYIFGGMPGAGIGSVIGRTAGRGLASVADSLGAFHKSTSEYQQDRTEELRKAGISEEYIRQREEGGFGSGYKDDPESYGRKFGMNDEKGVLTEAGKKDAASNWGAQGIVKAVGNDYFDKYNERQRYQITQGAIANNLLKGDKGDVIVTDDDAFLGTIEGSVANEEYGKMYDEWKKAHPELGEQSNSGGNGEKPASAPQAPKREAKKGAPPSLADVLPDPISPPIQPEPDDEPDAAEKQRVSNYQTMLENMLKTSKGTYGRP